MRKNYFLTVLAMLFCCLGMHAAAELTFKNVSLEPGSTIAGIEQNQEIAFNTNMDDEIGYMLVKIVDDEGTVVVSSATVYDPDFHNDGSGKPANTPTNRKDPHFTFVSPVNTTFYTGHEYSLVFSAYVDKDASFGAGNLLAQGSIKYLGSTKAYVNSSVKLLSITPDPKSYVIKTTEMADRTVTLTFSDKVCLDTTATFVNTGSGTSAKYAAIVAGQDSVVVDKVVYSTTWALTPSLGTINDGSDVIFTANAYDQEGLHVTYTAEGLESYTTGNTESSIYSFTVMNDLGKDKFDIYPAENDEYVNSLYTFKVANNELGIAAANIVEPAVLYKIGENGEKEQVAKVAMALNEKVVEPDPTDQWGEEHVMSQRLVLDKVITEAGNYVLHFPRGYFLFSTGMMAGSSAETDVQYAIAKDFVAPTVKLLTETTVKNLGKVEIQYPDYEEVDISPDNGAGVAFVVDANNQLVTKANMESCWDYMEFANVIDINMETPVTTPGTYKLIVPQDAVCAMNEGDGGARKAAKGGSELPGGDELDYNLLGAFVQEFTVEGGSLEGVAVKTDVENNSTVSKIDKVNITFESATGEDVVVEVMGWDTDAQWVGPSIRYASEVSVNGNVATVAPYSGGRHKHYGIIDAGTYSVTFPEGFFSVNGQDWPSFTLTYTVDGTATGINGVEANGAAAAKQVYTLTGIKVNGKAQKGIFIVNGKKVVLK